MHTCKSFPELYVHRICIDRFGTRHFEHLPTDKLCQLAMTLKNRQAASEEREPTQQNAMPEQAMEETVECPF